MPKPLVLFVAFACLAGCQHNQPQTGKSSVWDLRSNQELSAPERSESQQPPRESSTPRSQSATVTVRFRRDAMGLASNSGIPLFSNGTPNWPVSITGKLISRDENWVTLESNGHRYAIPASAILMVERE
jgi:hypothetical protein